MRISGRGGWAAALGCAAAVLLLLWPFQMPTGGPGWRAIGGSAHVVLLAGLAWLAGRSLSPIRRGWPLWIGLAMFSAGVEWLQPHVGRSAEWSDWLYGVGGAACICAGWRWRKQARWASVLALCLVPPAWETVLWQMESRAFPVLAQPGPFWAARGWSQNGVELVVSDREEFKLKPAWGDEPLAYPGLFRAPTRQDWRGIRSVEANLYWPEAAPAVFAVRVDDQPGNPPYAERFQKEMAVTQGWNVLHVSAKELERTAGGRPLRLERVRQWGVFLVSDVPFDYFSIGVVRLEMQEEHP